MNLNQLKLTTVLKIPRYDNISDVGNHPGMIGDIIFDRSTGLLTYNNGTVWSTLGSGGLGPQGPIGPQGPGTGSQGPTGETG